MLLVQGQPGVEISSVGISPDGTKVAFTSDSPTVNQVYDLYVIAAIGGVPFRVNPSRTSGVAQLENIGPPYTWSGDSRYLAFVGDLNIDDVFQAFCADTSTQSVAVPLISTSEIAIQTSGYQGVTGAIHFSITAMLSTSLRGFTRTIRAISCFEQRPMERHTPTSAPHFH